MKISYDIEVAVDTPYAEQYVAWLNAQGHRAYLGHSTGSYVSDPRTADNYVAEQTASGEEILRELWEKFCCEF